MMKMSCYKNRLQKCSLTVFVFAIAWSVTAVAVQEKESVIELVDADMIKTWINENRPFKVLDVRSRAEFVFIGHPTGSVNIPMSFWDPGTGWIKNEKFLEDIENNFEKDQTIVIMCRSGGRARTAARMMMKAGYTSVPVFKDGFEGSIAENGLRTVSGWKNQGLPSTYREKPYQPDEEKKEKPEFKDP